MMDELRYPIGKFEIPKKVTAVQRESWIFEIADIPSKLRTTIEDLTEEQLDTPYRAEGWTIRQVIHHLPDSHMNGYIRFKLALTEVQPLIRPFIEEKWANLEDYRKTPVEVSLILLESLHERWEILLRSLKPEDFIKKFKHPESGLLSLETALCLYAWHGRHHLAHITLLRERMGW